MALLCAFYASTLMIWDGWKDWNKNPVIISMDSLDNPLKDLEFPAVTLCPDFEPDRSALKEQIINLFQVNHYSSFLENVISYMQVDIFEKVNFESGYFENYNNTSREVYNSFELDAICNPPFWDLNTKMALLIGKSNNNEPDIMDIYNYFEKQNHSICSENDLFFLQTVLFLRYPLSGLQYTKVGTLMRQLNVRLKIDL